MVSSYSVLRRSIAFDVSSAPRQVAVKGFRGAPARPGADGGTLLLTATYDLGNSPIQTFPVKQPGVFDHVRLLVSPFNTRYARSSTRSNMRPLGGVMAVGIAGSCSLLSLSSWMGHKSLDITHRPSGH